MKNSNIKKNEKQNSYNISTSKIKKKVVTSQKKAQTLQ